MDIKRLQEKCARVYTPRTHQSRIISESRRDTEKERRVKLYMPCVYAHVEVCMPRYVCICVSVCVRVCARARVYLTENDSLI